MELQSLEMEKAVRGTQVGKRLRSLLAIQSKDFEFAVDTEAWNLGDTNLRVDIQTGFSGISLHHFSVTREALLAFLYQAKFSHSSILSLSVISRIPSRELLSLTSPSYSYVVSTNSCLKGIPFTLGATHQTVNSWG